MTADELNEVVASGEFRDDLEQISSYLASIVQERPIVYCLAKHLWKRKYKYELEAERKDLLVNRKRIEFKFNYDNCMGRLWKEFQPHLNQQLEAIRNACDKQQHDRGILKRIYVDVCEREPDLFVWIICSRNLSNVGPEDCNRIQGFELQHKWNRDHPYTDTMSYLAVAHLLLNKLQEKRQFSILSKAIETNGDFPSTYHFLICDFSSRATPQTPGSP